MPNDLTTNTNTARLSKTRSSGSTSLALALNLQPGFADNVDYPLRLPAPFIDPYRHIQYFHQIIGSISRHDSNLMTVPERVTLVKGFLAHDYPRRLKSMLDQRITEDEIIEVVTLIVSGMSLSQNMREEVVKLDAARVLRQGIHFSDTGTTHYPSLWTAKLARDLLTETAEFYNTEVFKDALKTAMQGVRTLRTCLDQLERKPDETMQEHQELMRRRLTEGYYVDAKCYSGEEPAIVSTDPEIAATVHEITGHMTWYIGPSQIGSFIASWPGRLVVIDKDDDFLESLDQQYQDHVLSISAKAEKLRERSDEFREYVRESVRSSPKTIAN
jgi:hypothetical protein